MEKQSLTYANLKVLFVEKYEQLSLEVKSKKQLHTGILIEISNTINEIKKYGLQRAMVKKKYDDLESHRYQQKLGITTVRGGLLTS